MSTSFSAGKKILIGFIIVAGLIAVGYFIFFGGDEIRFNKGIEDVSISISATSLLPALIHIADAKGYFLEEGVNVEVKGYSAGRFAFKAMLDGEADMATVSDPNIVAKSFERDDFMAFATIVDSADHVKVLTRKGTGIIKPVDLKGKKVATTKGTTAYFSMITFFVFNNLAIEDVELIDLKPGEMVEAIKNKEVDAIFTWEPNIMNAQKSLGDNALLLPNKYGYAATFSLASRNNFIKENPGVLKKVTRALIKAEEFIKDNRQKSIEIVSVAVDKDKQDIELLWDNYNFKIGLSQFLLISLEDQARWEIRYDESLVGRNIPNYLNYIYLDTLEAISPDVVTIIK